jgi:beta-aspartyl-peptidase (threonine type)
MGKFAIIIHGGAGPDSDHIKKNISGYKQGIQQAVDAGYRVLENGGTAIDAVEAAVRTMEDNPLFNAGRGAAINAAGEVELCSSIMDGRNRNSGAVAIVKNVKNPVSLAKAVMEKTGHIYIGSHGATNFAREVNASIEPDSYFITEHQYDSYAEAKKEQEEKTNDAIKLHLNYKMHGTVGAAAVDQHGNVAAATSTGGTEYAKEGRIGDSSMIGVGTYASNKTCAVSTTGDGELHIRNVSAFHISSLMEYKGLSLEEACRYFIQEKCGDEKGDMGVIGADPEGNIAFHFRADRMHRGWKTSDGYVGVGIYPGD